MSTQKNRSIAAFFKEARQELRLTQEELGARIGCQRYNIAKYETGRTVPPGDVVLKLVRLKESNICI